MLKELIAELRKCDKYEDCDITTLANKYGLRWQAEFVKNVFANIEKFLRMLWNF